MPNLQSFIQQKEKKFEKIYSKGKKIYKNFLSVLAIEKCSVSYPNSSTLELFVLLKEKKDKRLLLCEMMKEFLSNFDKKIIIKNHKLYKIHKVLKKLSNARIKHY